MLPDFPDSVAVIVVVPADTPVANPLEPLIVATDVLEEVQAPGL